MEKAFRNDWWSFEKLKFVVAERKLYFIKWRYWKTFFADFFHYFWPNNLGHFGCHLKTSTSSSLNHFTDDAALWIEALFFWKERLESGKVWYVLTNDWLKLTAKTWLFSPNWHFSLLCTAHALFSKKITLLQLCLITD